MFNRVLGFSVALALPAVLAAQTPSIPNEHASDTAKSKVAQAMERRATRVRGTAVGLDNRPVTPATPAVPATGATPATPSSGGSAATPATPPTPATPAIPASPSRKPESPGQSGSRRRP